MLSFLACIACLLGVAEMTERKWRHKESGFASNIGYTFKGKVRGAVDCSRVCSRQGSTKSYFYYDNTRECHCHDNVYTGAEFDIQSVQSARYYEEVVEAIELAGMTDLPCPSDASSATAVFRSGTDLFRVRAFIDIERPYDDAQAVCVSNGGILYKATTLEKFQLAQQLMTQCPAYMAYTNYFVNGKINGATNRYETSDGEVLPMTQDFWAPDRPNDSGILCIWMSIHFVDYRWDDRSCGLYPDQPVYAFCEIPQ